MNEDPRCCGSGTCIIDGGGRCWCGQQWDGLRMRHVPPAQAAGPVEDDVAEPSRPIAADAPAGNPEG